MADIVAAVADNTGHMLIIIVGRCLICMKLFNLHETSFLKAIYGVTPTSLILVFGDTLKPGTIFFLKCAVM